MKTTTIVDRAELAMGKARRGRAQEHVHSWLRIPDSLFQFTFNCSRETSYVIEKYDFYQY
ncbi:MAG: hypothetical protein ACRYGL_19645 [Janthinobacterium lividum]